MAKIFEEKNITAQGKVLPLSEFRLFLDLGEWTADPERAEKIIKEAERLVDEPIPFVTLSNYRDFQRKGSRSAYERPSSKLLNMLFPISLAEHYEKKGRFINKISDLIWAIMEQTSWVIPAHARCNPTEPEASVPPVYDEENLHGVDLHSAYTAAIMAMTLALHRDALNAISPYLTERLEYEIKKRSIRPFLSHRFAWSGSYGGKVNNWCPWIVSNILYITALLEKDTRVREAVVTRAMTYLDNYIAWIPPDGGCDEGPGYWGSAGGALFDSIELIYDMTGGKIDAFDSEILRLLGEYEVKFNIHDSKFVNFADCRATMYPDGYLLVRYGKRCGSEMLEAFGKLMTKHYPDIPSISHLYRSLKDMAMREFKDAEVTKAAKHVWMDYLKVMIARESEDTSVGMFLAIKGGNNRESHNHNDVGHFIVYYGGRPVIIDPGTVGYTKDTFGKNRYTIWAMQSHYHNLPAFNGVGEMQGASFASSREVYNPEAHKLTLGLEGAYPKEACLISYTREASLNSGEVTIRDEVHLDSLREIDFRLMTHQEPHLIENGRISLAEGRTLLYDTALEYECEVVDPVGANTVEQWGSPVLYRMHFRIIAKEYCGEMRFV